MRLRHCLTLVLIAASAAMTLSASRPSVRWSTLGNTTDPTTGRDVHSERFVITNHNGLKRLCFNRFARKMTPVNPVDTIAEIIPGYYYISSPRFATADGPVTVDVALTGPLRNRNYLPDGFHAVMADGSVVTADVSFDSMTDTPSQWATTRSDLMPYGDAIYRFNAALATDSVPGPYDVIPSLKSVSIAAAAKRCPATAPVAIKEITDNRADFYRITVGADSITIGYTSPESLKMARNLLYNRLIPYNPDGLPEAVIEDWPGLPYRAMMMDVARNFFNIARLQQLVQILASYRMNRLHFHFADDEAWRLEIPGLPELTDVGSRRGYTLDESDHLAQLFSGNGDPDNYSATANGYISRADFIDFLRYCDALGISVIPEIESPGHARAAIKAMRARYRRTGDDSYLLAEEGDSSLYTSAQAFHDNVMNPALPGPYRFMTKVIDEIAAMYREAGVELRGIHIGGDEVPVRAWDRLAAIAEMKRATGLTTQGEIHAAFVDSMARILSERDIPMYGWQDVAMIDDPDFHRRNAPLTGGINCWTLSNSGISRRIAGRGYPVILSNVDKFYLDQCYNYHPLEKGLTWGGTVDEFTTLSGYPALLCTDPDLSAGGKIIGVSGHLFGETLRSFDDVLCFILPKIAGLAERAWNPEPTFSDSRFNAVIATRELPSLARRGYNFHLRQPGILVEGDTVRMNSPYPAATIRYTLDGSIPVDDSPEYTGPFTVADPSGLRARLFYLGRRSLTTFPAP